jgi:hypothetical protein
MRLRGRSTVGVEGDEVSNELLRRIQMAQVEAGEQAVVEDLRRKGLLPVESDCLNSRYPEYGPCSACGDGDMNLQHHSHEPKNQPCWYGPNGAGHTFDHGADTCRCGNVRRSPKQGIVIDLDHLRQRMAQFVTEVSPHDPTAYTIPFEIYLQWEMRQRQEKESENGHRQKI